MKKLVSLLLAILMVLGLAPLALMEEPIAISLYYSDNATLPFRQDWPVIQQLEKSPYFHLPKLIFQNQSALIFDELSLFLKV